MIGRIVWTKKIWAGLPQGSAPGPILKTRFHRANYQMSTGKMNEMIGSYNISVAQN